MDHGDGPRSALATYQRLAPVYDRFAADYDHATWLDRLEAAARHHGLAGRRLLDVGCGTGSSFLPLLARGYQVTACDLSPAMAATAQDKAGRDARVFVADMRALPDCGRFDLITCLDDAVNYLLSGEDLGRFATAAGARLVPGGLLVFDVNTLGTYRSAFAGQDQFSVGGVHFRWRGRAAADLPAGAVAHAEVTARGALGDVQAIHVQRHHPPEDVARALRAAGLEIAAVLGQSTGCHLDRRPDELRRTKTVFIARRAVA